MFKSSKIIGTTIATTGLIVAGLVIGVEYGAVVGIGVVFAGVILASLIKLFTNKKILLAKVAFIFICGFLSRYIVNSVYDVNVLTDFYSAVSIIYYIVFAYFSATINEIFTNYGLNSICNYVYEILSDLYKKCLVNIYSFIVKLGKV